MSTTALCRKSTSAVATAMAPAAASNRIVRINGGAKENCNDEKKDRANETTHGRTLSFRFKDLILER